EPGCAAIGEAQDVIVEPVLLVPHAVRTDPVHRTGNQKQIARVTRRQILIDRVVCRKLESDLDHVLAVKGHPRGAIGLLQIASGRQRRTAVEDADVVEPENPPLKQVPAVAVFAVYPPAEVRGEPKTRLRNSRSVLPRNASSIR